ncbi:hypothetical protein [Paenibacillus sp. S150]|uniref:hypothetical protein n=1 Tax=Paenibacillus sp. S150 TaxID=2749826 RepID=UPI001C55C3E8|nr:hypothetical protein [Paenibacillus sp. S150]MBW4085055.1 hypothetical protein [Paenibacillus sp. S150]
MESNANALTVIFIILALVIIGVFFYRIRKGTFREHLMAEAAIAISFVVVSIAAADMAFAVRILAPAAVAAMFEYGRRKSG